MVVIDLGAKYDGYCSDITRTGIVGGNIPSNFMSIFNCIDNAMDIALSKVSDGIMASVVDAAARGVIDNCGYSQYFIHGLGHGVGLSVHEAPSLSSKSNDVLREGNVITIEPGIYIPGVGGVRLEDMIVVTKHGYERLNHLERILLLS